MDRKRLDWERIWRKKYLTEHPAKHLLYLARARAKRKNTVFALTEQDIHIPEKCPYLGTPLQANCRRGELRTNIMTLDRIDNTKGYIPGNVEVISWVANTMKSNATPAQLVAFAKAILQRYT